MLGLVKKIGLPILLMLVLVLSRWPGMMPQNFSAAYAMAFCAGVYFPRWTAWLTLAAIFLSDVLMKLFYYHVAAVGWDTLSNYLAYFVIFFLGRKFNAKSAWIKLLGGGLLGAIVFYLVTNTAAWLQIPEYPKTLAGWIQALTTGLPKFPTTLEFFRNTLLSGGIFTGLFVGAMKMTAPAESPEEKKEPAPEPVPAESEEAQA